MASSSPPILPTTTTTTTTNSSSAFRLFLSRLSDSTRRSLSHRRPWSELLDWSAFSRPDSVSSAAARLRRNLPYFRVNYLLLLAVALAFSLLTHPFSLFLLLSLLGAWSFLYLFRPNDSPPLVLLGRQFSDRETLAALSLLTLLVIFLTSVGSLIVSALTVGSGLVCLHAAFRVPEDLFLDDQEAAVGAGAGLLSFLGGVDSSAVAAAVRV
ncbi:PRA1 family protein B3-like [Typha angustifolia]|uniref:PRA1 family protein B3-like n=1 Tax=Typha angustifolia TaxID=59011 RepID=UPI003C2AD7B4